MMQLDHMQYFVKTVECGSINKTASRLYLTQPTLSQAIKNFEKELNITLLQRTINGTVPTILGNKIYQECKTILEQVERFHTIWKEKIEYFKEVSGTVTVGVFPLLSPYLATSFSQQVQDICPNICISVMDLPLYMDPGLFIQKDSLSIGLGVFEYESAEQCSAFIAAVHDMNLEITVLQKDELRILINKKNPLAKKEFLTKKDLNSITNIAYYDGQREKIYQLPGSTQTLHANTMDQILYMLNNDLGVWIAGGKLANKHYITNSFVNVMPVIDANYPPIFLYKLHHPYDQMNDATKVVCELMSYSLADGSADEFIRKNNLSKQTY
jgi:DNA-binding transcriptional LysR family regulator